MRRFELSEGKSSKFWQIALDATSFTVQWGRIGTGGQAQTKTFASADAAKAEHDKLVAEKKKKGYVEVEVAASAKMAATQALQSSAKAEAKSESSDSPAEQAAARSVEPDPLRPSAPDLDLAPRLVLSDELRAATMEEWIARTELPALDEAALLEGLRRHIAGTVHNQGPTLVRWTAGRALADAAGVAVLEHLLATYAAGKAPGTLDPDLEAGAAVLLHEKEGLSLIACYWVARAGLEFAIDAFARMRGYRRQYNWRDAPHPAWLTSRPIEEGWDTSLSSGPMAILAPLVELRRRSSAAEQSKAREAAARLREGSPVVARFGLALVFGDEAWAAEDARAVLELRDVNTSDAGLLVYFLRERALLEEFAARFAPRHGRVVVARAGVDAVATVAKIRDVDALVNIESIEAARALVSFLDDKLAAPKARAYFERSPDLGMLALAPVVTGRGKLATYAEPLLKSLLRAHPGLPDRLASVLDARSRAWIEEQRKPVEVAFAAQADLPTVLTSPPWLAPRPSQGLPTLALEVLGPQQPPAWSADKRRRALSRHEPLYIYSGVTVPKDLKPQTSEMDEFARANLDKVRWYKERLVHATTDAFVEAGLADGSIPHMGAEYIYARFGERLWPKVVEMLSENAQDLLASFGEVPEPRLAGCIALALDKKTLRRDAVAWLKAQPEVASVGLVPLAFGADRRARHAAHKAIRLIAREHRDVVRSVAASYGTAAAEAMDTLLALPADEYPAKMPTSPKFLDLTAITPPRLQDGGGALPLNAMANLITILQLSPLEAPLTVLADVISALEPASAAQFAWQLFQAWLAAGAPAKEIWAFHAVGHLGDDEAARVLTPMIRAWPGESAHARAVVGLEVLTAIGTDVALMHLHGIAQKLKFKALQEKARAQIDAIAENRGLTADELADRLVPDLGLEDDGTLTLDFGPRQFTVGFDEALRPFVRDAAGKRTDNLPKPGKADDPEKSAQAVEQLKTLKKDAKAIAQGQVMRFELVMCAQRRFDAASFRRFFVEHPLMIHLTRRVLWGVYGDGRLSAGFRVAEDRSFADAEDCTFELATDATVGLVHRLELDDAQTQSWSQIFADYEILQPFDQLGRAVYQATDAERTSNALRRLEGVSVKTGKVLGLEARGWRKGAPQDAGVIGDMYKPLPGGLRAELPLDGGLYAGAMADSPPEQKLDALALHREGEWKAAADLTFGSISPVLFSELVRDLEAMRG